MYELYSSAIREAVEEVFCSIYTPQEEVNWLQVVTPFTISKTRNKSLVPYDKSIAKQKIKQNQERYKTVAMNRRLETKRVRTHLRK